MIRQEEARQSAAAVAAAIEKENRSMSDQRSRLTPNFEERLKPSKDLKDQWTTLQHELVRARRHNDELSKNSTPLETSLLTRLEHLREEHQHELQEQEDAKADLEEERKRAQKLEARLQELEAEAQVRAAEMRRIVEAYESVLALCIEPYERGGLKIKYIDLRRSFVLRLKADDSPTAEIVGVSGCDEIAAEFNRRLNVGALLYRMREVLKGRAS